jgi:diguanylate cyclase (GGDEF)-like protein
MAVFICSAFLYLSGKESLIIYSIAWLVMAVSVWIFQTNTTLAFSNIINGFIMACLALFTSKMIYFNRLQEFLNLRVIEQQQEELQRSNVQLERLSYRDSLTDLPNRRYFDDYISRQWMMAARKKEALSLIMIDMDYFKQYNDTYGHLAGDECLITVVSTLNKLIKRPYDLLVRYGGEEFLVVLPQTMLPGARYLAENMRSVVAELQIEHPCSAFGHLTISLGVAESYPTGKNGPEVLIAVADEALYEAKKAGRNQVCWIKV